MSLGMLPDNLAPMRLMYVAFFQALRRGAAGAGSENAFLARTMDRMLDNIENVAGTAPPNVLFHKLKDVSCARLPKVEGKLPDNAFCPSSKNCSAVRFPRVAGIVPVKFPGSPNSNRLHSSVYLQHVWWIAAARMC